MFRLLPLTTLTLVIISTFSGVLLAAGTSTITYQGRLTDAQGLPLDGDYEVTFSIYSDSLGQFLFWSEAQQVSCVNGLFTVVLGKITPFPGYTFSQAAIYLGIAVGDDPEMSPRQRFYSNPFAMRVGTIDGATAGQISGNLNVNNWVAGQTAVLGYGGLQGGHFQAADPSPDAVGLRGFYGGYGMYDAVGVEGESVAYDGYGIGGSFTGGWYGVEAMAEVPNYSTMGHYGISASANGFAGSGSHYGVYASAGGGLQNYGVRGYAYHNGTPFANAYGVYGSAGFSDGYGAWAGYFNGWTTCNGTLEVLGTLLKPGGAFRIDHPLDPENKYLQHSFVESPDMMNIYNGNITTDDKGDATVSMPDWFSALNRDFRYQLTVIGQFAQAIVSDKMKGDRFSIKTDKPNVEVSWQVTGIRKDAYADAHRIEVEVLKKPQERGLYIDPVAFGKSPELQLHYKLNKAAEDDRKADEERSAKNHAEKKAAQQKVLQ